MGSGIVEAAGEGVTGLAPGDRVAMIGVGHQAYAALPAEQVQKVPDGFSLRDASLSYLAAWSLSALHLAGYRAAETAVLAPQPPASKTGEPPCANSFQRLSASAGSIFFRIRWTCTWRRPA
ncbi:MAG: hypothetical protein C4346_12510 [Chloroflexota bacterium]